MGGLYEDGDFIGGHGHGREEKPDGVPARDPLFYRGAHQRSKFNRYEPGYSSRPATKESAQAWTRAPLGGYGHDNPDYYSDDQIRGMVEASLAADPHLSEPGGGAIKVAVEGGHVTLSGAVGSEKAKSQAESDAQWTAGVKGVTSKITIGKRE